MVYGLCSLDGVFDVTHGLGYILVCTSFKTVIRNGCREKLVLGLVLSIAAALKAGRRHASQVVGSDEGPTQPPESKFNLGGTQFVK